jgi:hypothetical protein
VIYLDKEQAFDRQCLHIIMKAGEAGKKKSKEQESESESRSQNKNKSDFSFNRLVSSVKICSIPVLSVVDCPPSVEKGISPAGNSRS